MVLIKDITITIKVKAREQYISLLKEYKVANLTITDKEISFTYNNVRVYAVKEIQRLPEYFSRIIKKENPDYIFVSADGLAQGLLERALHEDPGKIIYLARTTMALPFGPESSFPAPGKIPLLKKIAGIITVSHFIKEYIRTWTGISSEVLPISLYGNPPFPYYGSFDSGYVTMINPCAYKGIHIFVALAKALPSVSFAAVPTWGTTEKDMHMLKSYSNISIVDPVDDIDLIFKKTKLLLFPSLWQEARGRSIGEALLRGIPVLASNVGGTREAICGLDFLLPVTPITKYHNTMDSRQLPVAEVPEQDITPWLDTFVRILNNRSLYEELSEKSRRVSHAILIKNTGVERVEEYLLRLKEKQTRKIFSHNQREKHGKDTHSSKNERIQKFLTPEQRAILCARIRKQK
jgi:glycosyltransferase involved in cell wall biosynthesis